MKPLLINIDTDSALLHLTRAEAEAPNQIRQDYCDDYTPGACRAYLDGLVKTALIYDETNNNPARREALLCWRDRTVRLMEAEYAQQRLTQLHPDLVQFGAVPLS